MARQKKKDENVVLEDMRSQFKVFGEALQGLREEMGTEFRSLRHEMNRRFDAVDARADRTDRELALVKTAVLEHGRELREMRGDSQDVRSTVTRIEHALEKKVDRDEVEAVVARVIAR